MLTTFERNCLPGEVQCAFLTQKQQQQVEQLQQEHLVFIQQTNEETCIKPDIEGMDQWIRRQFTELENDL